MRLSLGAPASEGQQVRHLLSLWGDPLVGTNGRHAAEARKSWPEGDPVAVAMIGLQSPEGFVLAAGREWFSSLYRLVVEEQV